jgi:phosphatidylserine/phosphatidylglycerophosphate/cardiolipin synthase-like enzyme
MSGTNDATRHLAEIAAAALDATALDDLCSALESGELQTGSTAPIRDVVAHGRRGVESRIRELQELWRQHYAELSPSSLALVLRASAAAVQIERQRAPQTHLVWTGPKVDGSFFRATREVMREILTDANRALLVVGYWLAARDDCEGIIEELMSLLANAVQRGVATTMVLDERRRPDGRDNRTILVDVWPRRVPLPLLLTWRLPGEDAHLKLHAKAIVADEHDALVTSANLTSYALDRNIEMGVRVQGRPAADLARHFRLLHQTGILEPYAGTVTP